MRLFPPFFKYFRHTNAPLCAEIFVLLALRQQSATVDGTLSSRAVIRAGIAAGLDLTIGTATNAVFELIRCTNCPSQQSSWCAKGVPAGDFARRGSGTLARSTELTFVQLTLVSDEFTGAQAEFGAIGGL